MSFPAYGSYKDAHAEGLGSIPSHWELSRLGYESWVRARLGWKGLKADEYVEDGYALLATPNIKNREIDFDGANRVTLERYDESPEIKISLGDILLAKDGSTLGTVNIVRSLPRPATVNSSLAIITPNEACHDLFLFFYFQSSFVRSRIDQLKGGMGVPHLFQDDLNRFPLPMPPSHEQRLIAAFLDRETAKIDALVEAQERLIALLGEKREAVISHAVTKGLDPSAPMKDSGVEWLGQVPAHWEVLRLKDLATPADGIQMGPFGGMLKDLLSEPAAFKVYGQENVTNGDFDRGSRWIHADRFLELCAYELKVGDLMLTRKGSVGNCYMFPGTAQRGIIDSDTIRIRLTPSLLDLQFALRILHEARYIATQIDLTKRGAILAGLNTTVVSNLIIATPPLHEQIGLLAHLDAETAKFDALTAQAEAAITLLQERRAALISAAVTGKIDVRGLAPTVQEASAA